MIPWCALCVHVQIVKRRVQNLNLWVSTAMRHTREFCIGEKYPWTCALGVRTNNALSPFSNKERRLILMPRFSSKVFRNRLSFCLTPRPRLDHGRVHWSSWQISVIFMAGNRSSLRTEAVTVGLTFLAVVTSLDWPNRLTIDINGPTGCGSPYPPRFGRLP